MTWPWKNSWRNWDLNQGSFALEADALTTWPTRWSWEGRGVAGRGGGGVGREDTLHSHISLRWCVSGIRTPTIFMVDMETKSIYMEYVEPSITVREFISCLQENRGGDDSLLGLAEKIGEVIGKAHKSNIIHGDLTTSNMLLTPCFKAACQTEKMLSPTDIIERDIHDLDIVLIDFGLTALEGTAEDKGVDLYVLERALLSTHPNTDHVFEAILASYRKHNPGGQGEVIKKLDEVRLRGRKRTMVGWLSRSDLEMNLLYIHRWLWSIHGWTFHSISLFMCLKDCFQGQFADWTDRESVEKCVPCDFVLLSAWPWKKCMCIPLLLYTCALNKYTWKKVWVWSIINMFFNEHAYSCAFVSTLFLGDSVCDGMSEDFLI